MTHPDPVPSESAPVPGRRGARFGLGTQILVGMVVGTVLGAVLGERVSVVQPLGDLFIRLLILAAVPLVFFNLLAGVTALSDLRTFGRLAGKIVGYFVVTDLIALSLGLLSMAILRRMRRPMRTGRSNTCPQPADSTWGTTTTSA